MKAQNKTMKTIITSNWRPLHRALCTLLVGIAALWAMPRSAHAQLYVGNQLGTFGSNTGSVGEYDATTGAAISSFTPITGLNAPSGLAVSGTDLFVSNFGASTVGEYTTSGATINASLIKGLSGPGGLAVGSVPEPSPWSMIAIGGVALLGIMHWKKHRSA